MNVAFFLIHFRVAHLHLNQRVIFDIAPVSEDVRLRFCNPRDSAPSSQYRQPVFNFIGGIDAICALPLSCDHQNIPRGV